MIITPRKLQIDLPLGYGFALIARLFPRVDAFTFLKRVEGIQKIHSLAGFITGIVCFLLELNAFSIALWTFGVTVVFFLLRYWGVFILPGLVQVATYYTYITGFGLVTLTLCAIGFWKVGFWGLLAFWAARAIAELLSMLLDQYAGKRLGMEIGSNPALADAGAMFLAPAKDFVNAYRLYADKFDLSRNAEVSEEEMHFENWRATWEDFQTKWPQVTARYDENPYDWI